MKKLLSLLIISVTCSFAQAQTWQDTVVMIEKMFERFKPTNPGCQLAISRNGSIIFSKAWGMANLEHDAPLTRESVIEAGSVSKQFTAAAILLLEQQGKLSLNDDVRKYLPEMPDYGSPITLRHMMQHTSGLKDWGSVAAIAGWPRSTKTYDNNDALYIASRQKTLNNNPGDEFIYSNSNYNLLAVIVQRVSGTSLAEFTRKHIFEPAGMKHTQWRDDYKRIVRGRAIAYAKAGNNYRTEMPNEYVYGNGGLLTTAEDLLTWNNYFLSGKLGSPSLLSKQLALTPLNNGGKNAYAAGLFIDSVRGWKTISHNGATAGYRANLEYFPDLGLSIALLCNTSEVDQGPNPATEVRNLLVKNNVAPITSAIAAYPVAEKSLYSYPGWYYSPRTGVGIKLFIRDGSLASNRGNMAPIGENLFQLGNNTAKIVTSSPRHLLLISQSDTIFFAAMDSAVVTEKSLRAYTGKYYSEETESSFEVKFENARLMLHRASNTIINLIPTYKDGFDSNVGSIHFIRLKSDEVIGFRVYIGRARNVVFYKVK